MTTNKKPAQMWVAQINTGYAAGIGNEEVAYFPDLSGTGTPEGLAAARRLAMQFKASARVIEALMRCSDEASHILGTEAKDREEVARINATAIQQIAHAAIREAAGES